MTSLVMAVGVDIVQVGRIGRALERWGDRFLRRVYTPEELAYARGRLPQLAARFAAKEAVMKALGTGRIGVGWREIEILRGDGGKPVVFLHGRAKARAQKMELQDLTVSLSHSRDYAIALVAGGTA